MKNNWAKRLERRCIMRMNDKNLETKKACVATIERVVLHGQIGNLNDAIGELSNGVHANGGDCEGCDEELEQHLGHLIEIRRDLTECLDNFAMVDGIELCFLHQKANQGLIELFARQWFDGICLQKKLDAVMRALSFDEDE